MPEKTARMQPEHGTEARYMRGCRCSACKSARTAAQRRRRESKKVDATRPVTAIGDAPSAAGRVQSVEAAVQVMAAAAAQDSATQVHAQMALALARRLDNGDAGGATLAAQLQVLLTKLKPLNGEAGAGAPGAPRLARVFGTRGRVDPGAVPGPDRVAAVGDQT